MGPRGLGRPIIRRLERMRGAHQYRTATALRRLVKRTIQIQEPTPRRTRLPMPTGATEARSFQRTAILPTLSTRLRLKGPWEPAKLRRGAKGLPRPVHTGVPLPAKRQTATSTPPRMATSTRTPGAAGSRPRVRNPPNIIRTRAALRRLTGMEGRQKVADQEPLAELTAAVGNPGQRVLVVRQAAVAAADGAVAGEPTVRPEIVSISGGCHVAQTPQTYVYDPVPASGISHCPCRVQQIRQTFGQSI